MNNFDLDASLIDFTGSGGYSTWTVREAVEGTQIFGGIGSGKTSGSGRMLALKYLTNGFGGLVLTAKPDEKKLWQEYCRLTNRTEDLIIVEPGGKHYFNFVEYESAGESDGTVITENIVQVLKTVIRASQEKGGKSDDSFWEDALDMLIFNVIDLCILAYGKVSIQLMYDIVLTAPKNGVVEISQSTPFVRAIEQAQRNIKSKIAQWENLLSEERKRQLDDPDIFDLAIAEELPAARLLKTVDQFFVESFQNLSDKTRSVIEFSFSGFLFRLLKEPVYSLFCRYASTFTPEDCLDGKIILLNIPVKEYHKVGRDAQVMFKYIWQRSMEKRDVSLNERPLFLWADEAQHFLHEHDADYQATARSSRIATVYISQNLPNYYANMGGTKSEHKVKSFLGTLGTKIFHSNGDLETNKYASDLIGEAYIADHTRNTTVAGNLNINRGPSYKLEKMVRPEHFGTLRNGGALKSHKVDGYVHRQGHTFPTGFNHELITFSQLFSNQ